MAVKWCYNQVIELWHGFQELGTGVKILLSIMFPFVGVIWAVTEALQAMGVVETVEQRKTREAIEAKMKISTEAHNKRVEQIKEQMKFVKAQQEAEKAATDLALKNIDREIELRQAAGESVKDLEKAKLQILINSAQQQYRLSKTLLELQDAELLSRRQHNIDIQKDAGKNTEQLEKALEFEKRQRALNIEENLATEKQALDDALHNLKVFNITMETERRNANKKEIEEAETHEEELQRVKAKRLENIDTTNKEVETKSANHWIRMGQIAKEAGDKQKKEDEEELARKLANIKQVDEYASQGFEFLSNLSSAFSKDSEKDARRQFNINKASGIAQATTSTAQAVVAQLAVPQDALTGANFVKAGIAGAIGLSQILKISKTQFGGGGSGGGGGVSIPRVSSGGANGGTGGQAQQNDNLTNIAQLLNQQPRPVLVVDSFNKVDREAEKIRSVASI
jgi:hypothetical protein